MRAEQRNKIIIYSKKTFSLFKNRFMIILIILLLGKLISFRYMIMLFVIYIFYLSFISPKRSNSVITQMTNCAKGLGTLAFFIIMFRLIGVIGLIAFIVITSIFLIIKRFHLIIEGRNLIEESIWGKTLNKENWINERPKKFKLKFRK